MPEIVPLDAPQPSALLCGAEHLLELSRPQQSPVVVAEDQLRAVTDRPKSRRQLGCEVHPALPVALRCLDGVEARGRRPPDVDTREIEVDIRPPDCALLPQPHPRVQREQQERPLPCIPCHLDQLGRFVRLIPVERPFRHHHLGKIGQMFQVSPSHRE